MTQSKPGVLRLLLGLLEKRFTLNSVKLCGCEARVSVAILLPSDKKLRTELTHRDWSQEMKCKKPRPGNHVCTPAQILPGATLPPGVFTYTKEQTLFLLCQNCYKRIHPKVCGSTAITLCPLPFFFVGSAQNHSSFRPSSNATSSNKQTMLSWAKRILSLLWVLRAFYMLVLYNTSLTILLVFS